VTFLNSLLSKAAQGGPPQNKAPPFFSPL